MKIFSFLILFILVGCGSTAIHTPNTKMLSPESQGQWNGSAEMRAVNYKRDKADFGDNTLASPLAPAHTNYTASSNAEYGLTRRFDVYANPNFLVNAPTIIGGKYQILGKSRDESTKGDFSLSLHAGLGKQQGKSRDSKAMIRLDRYETDDNIKEIWLSTHHREIGLISGYRWHDKIVHYLSGHYFKQNITGTVTTKDKVIFEKNFDFSQEGLIYSTGIIHYITKWLYYKVDFSHMKSDYAFAAAKTTNSVNAAFGFYW